MKPTVLTIADRYQIAGEPVGEGGMGVVYKAYDPVTRRHVAVKTMRGAIDAIALELFTKEWTVLSRINHPNIVDIFDTGEFEEGGQRKPFFVMPFLTGRTFDYLIRNASQRLTVERLVEIMAQTCRGLQAAHENGLIHRDVKPSNIFVMDDDTVKVIDFGVAHLAGADTVTGIKGTLQYMSPEQLEMKPTTPASDIFSLAVVCYEALTGRKPFARRTDSETVEAIRRHVPPPACDLNPLASQLLSRVIHKALAKAPYHRFSSAREFSETLVKALNNQPIERFDKSKLQPRIERARKAQAEGDLQFASEVLAELEAEGHFDPEMTVLRMQINQAIRQKSIRQLLDSARTRREEDELPLALQKIHEVLEIDRENSDALALRKDIEKELSERQLDNWFRLAEQHVHHCSFAQARQALEEVLEIDSGNARAHEALLDIDRREQEINRIRTEKEHLYQAALSSYQNGEISAALSKLERVLEFSRTAPDSAIPDRDAQYQGLYNQIRTERDAARTSYEEGRRSVADKNFKRALEICDEFLKRYPSDPLFQALKLEAEEKRRQERSSFIAEVAQRAEAEPDLDRRVNILKEAAERYPDEPHFQQSLRLIRDRRDLVNSIIARARQYEERGQFGEALGQWDILRNIYAQYPGIEFEVEKLTRRRDEQLRAEARARWVEQIDRTLASGDYARARDLVRGALREFPDDRELGGLEKLAQQALERAGEAETWLRRGQKLCFDREFGQGLEALRKAAALNGANPVIRAALLNALVEQARSVLGQDWRAAEPLVQQALSIDGGHPLAKSLQSLVLDYKRQEMVNETVAQARELQAAGDIRAAVATLDEALKSFPNELRLAQLRTTLTSAHSAIERASQSETAPAEAAPAAQKAAAAAVAAPPLEATPEKEAAPAPTMETAALPAAAAVRSEPAGTAAKPEPPAKAESKSAAPTPRHAASRIALPRFSARQWSAVALLPVVAVVAVVVAGRRPKPVPVPKGQTWPVRIAADVSGAGITVDGRRVTSLPLMLNPGQHRAEARAIGYQTAAQTFTVVAGAAEAEAVVLHPLPEPIRVRISSDLDNGVVTLDGKPSGLQDGAFMDERVKLATEHTLTLSRSGKEVLSISFRAEPGKPVILRSPLKAGDVNVLAVGSLGAQARIYSSDGSVKAGLARQTPQPIPAEGLEISGLQSDSELVAIAGNNQRPVPVDTGNFPALSIVLSGNPDTATVRIQCSVPDADVAVAGRRPRRMHGASTTLQLAPGKYAIRVSKDGYNDENQTVELAKGQSVSLPVFDLKPVVHLASLVIEGATPGAEVWIDGSDAGTVGMDGGFSRDGITPENHSIALRKAEFEDKSLERSFTAGQTTKINGADARLTAFGALAFQVVPENATISYKGEQEQQAHTAQNGIVAHIAPGRYVVSASANGRAPRTESMTIPAGETKKVDWFLTVLEAQPKAQPDTGPFDRASWTKVKDGWTYHEGKGMAWLASNEGDFKFTIRRPAEGKAIFGIRKAGRIDWVVDWKDAGNTIRYSLDQKSLERKLISEGRTGSTVKKPASMGAGETWSLEIVITPERIVIRSGGKDVDSFARSNTAQPLGRIGFEGDIEVKPQ